MIHVAMCNGSMDWVSVGSDNGLLSGQHQAITSINADLLSIGSLEQTLMKLNQNTKFFIKENNSATWQPFCSGFIVLTHWPLEDFDLNLGR